MDSEEVADMRINYRKALNALVRIALARATAEKSDLIRIADEAMREINPTFSEWRK